MKDAKIEQLQAIPLFSRLGTDDLLRVGQLTDEGDVPAGHVLMRQGAGGHEAFVIADGRVAIERDGRQIAERGAGEVLGELAILSEGPRTATVTALTPCRLMVLGRREFRTLMDEQPSIRLAVLDQLARRLRTLEVDAAH